MKTKRNVRPVNRKDRDLLDELIEEGNIDEISLLDLIFIEEILNQKKEEPVI